MIILHSVTKTLGRGKRKNLVLDRVDWTIDRGAQIAVLGQQGAGKSTLLDILSGASTPTAGWVERRALVSPRAGLTRYAQPFTSARQFIDQHSHLYQTDPRALAAFVAEFTGFGAEMDIPIHHLTRHARQLLNLALFYGTPFDFYLFDGKVSLGRGSLQQRLQAAFKLRRLTAGMILATASVKAASAFGGAGGVLHRGHLMLFATVEEAIRVHEYLLIHDPLPTPLTHRTDLPSETEEDFD